VSVSLKQMRYAMAVAKAGHFGQAASACAVSQPALSQQIAALEDFCGTPLFDRLKSGVKLTPFGREFVELAQETLRTADAVEQLARGRADKPQRPIRFGLIPTVAPYLLPNVFPALQRGFPELRFTISENRTEDLLDGLEDGSLDIALIASEPPAGGPKFSIAPLFEDPFVLATPQGEEAADVDLHELPPDRILLLNEGHCFRDQAIAACGLSGGRGSNSFAATSLSTIVEFVANGQGVTLLPKIALRKEATNPRIAIHTLKDTSASRQLSLVWRDGAPFEGVYASLANVIRKASLLTMDAQD
jgi:LysR family hydrogen peroxide-inducible transcriptional activator